MTANADTTPRRIAIPRKPDEAMLAAGMSAGSVTAGTAYAIWTAMLAAAVDESARRERETAPAFRVPPALQQGGQAHG